jgi:putative transposase
MKKAPMHCLNFTSQSTSSPDFVRYTVQRLKTLCPSMGKVKIAQTLARAGLHLGATTVGRILKEPPKPTAKKEPARRTETKIVANYPRHVYHIDLTVVPIGSGFWTSWLPFALPQCWPFCWWVTVVIDHFSRRIVDLAVFAGKPDYRAVCAFLGRSFSRRGKPTYLICDRDSIFDCDVFRRWVKRRGIKPPRYGAVGKHGSIAVIERFFRTFKTELTRQIAVPSRRRDFRQDVVRYIDWYNEHRPHMTLGGRTPNEVYFGCKPANRRPRIEPRRRWPRNSKCAKPQTQVAGQPGDVFALDVTFLHGQRHLPVVALRRAA